jgi:hypothetical protein
MQETFFFVQDNDPRFEEYQSRLLNIVSWDGVEQGDDPNIGGVRGVNRVMTEGPRAFFGGGAGLFSTGWKEIRCMFKSGVCSSA